MNRAAATAAALRSLLGDSIWLVALFTPNVSRRRRISEHTVSRAKP